MPLLKAEVFCFGARQFCIPDKGKHGWRRLPVANDSRRWFFIHLFFYQWFHSSQCHKRVCCSISLPLCSKNTCIPSKSNSEQFCSLQGLPIWHPHFKHQWKANENSKVDLQWTSLCSSGLNTTLLYEGARSWALYKLPITRSLWGCSRRHCSQGSGITAALFSLNIAYFTNICNCIITVSDCRVSLES